jgi:hypothetical protein
MAETLATFVVNGGCRACGPRMPHPVAQNGHFTGDVSPKMAVLLAMCRPDRNF